MTAKIQLRRGGPWAEFNPLEVELFLREEGTPVIIKTTGGDTYTVPAKESVTVYAKTQ